MRKLFHDEVYLFGEKYDVGVSVSYFNKNVAIDIRKNDLGIMNILFPLQKICQGSYWLDDNVILDISKVRAIAFDLIKYHKELEYKN